MTLLSVHGIRKSFGPVEVLHGVDLNVDRGEVVALLGENGAGKSTLVRILAGDHQPDAGEVRIDNHPVRLGSVSESRSQGIQLISQEINDAPSLSVAENISLGAWPLRAGLVSRKHMRRTAREVLTELGSEMDVDRPVSSLRLGERQILEIARALVGDNRCLIFDEPTAALSDAEAQRLFELIGRLRAQHVAVIYITHRLDEVFRIAGRVSVLRDGRISLDAGIGDVDTAAVVTAMVGRGVAAERRTSAQPEPAAEPTPRIALRDAGGPAFDAISLEAHGGRVLGLYGKVGSGASEVAESLFGIHALTAGELLLDGRSLRLRGPAEAIRHGIGFLPPDRKEQAVLTGRSLAENVAAPSWRRLATAGLFLTRGTEARAYRRWHDVLAIRSRNDPAQVIGTLSGGNQQKVLLGRWLECESSVLVLVEPTRGVDVGARQEIYQAIRRVADGGTAVVLASSDYEDIVAVCDEALVMVRGHIAERHTGAAINVESLTTSAGGAVHA